MAKKAKRSATQPITAKGKKSAPPARLPARPPAKKQTKSSAPATPSELAPRKTAAPRRAAASAKSAKTRSSTALTTQSAKAAAKKRTRAGVESASAAAPANPAAKAAKEPAAKKQNTSEENRGAHFFSVIRMWRLLHADGGRTLFNKELLARRYFEGIEDEENPEPELHAAEAEDEFNDDPYSGLEGGMDGVADEASHTGLRPAGTGSGMGRESGKTPKPYSWIKEKHKRFVQRTIDKLKNYGIGIEDTDAAGNPIEDIYGDYREANPTAERWWRYNPNGRWAEEFDKLLNKYGVTGTELLAFMALRDLLEDMRGTPHQRALQEQLDRMMRCVPPKLRDEAIEQSRAYRHSVGNTAKYIPKADDLERWYAAALHRQQVEIDYTTPGDVTRSRHVAALSTMFHREENSLYLLASEKTPEGWGPVRQWKCDRVKAVRTTGLDNPRLADLHADPLVRAAPGGGRIERLDADRVYDYSAGAWLEIGVKPQRMEVLVRVPAVGRPGMEEHALKKLQQEARRRAYGWMEWCLEKPFHPRQDANLEPLASGEKQLRLVVEKCYVKEMASRLLRLQDCFEVIAPHELVVLVRDYANSISRSHP